MAPPRHRRHTPPEQIDLPLLAPFAGTLADGVDYEDLDLAGLDLSGASAIGASFLGCRIEHCTLDDVRLDRARIAETHIRDVGATAIHAGDTNWQGSLLADARVGALLASGSTWDLVRLRGIKANLLDLRASRLTDVVLEDCAIGELDLGLAKVRSLRVVRSTIGDLSVEDASLADVDLTGARLAVVRGVVGLRGATIGVGQLQDLAPLLATSLGIEVRG